MTWKQATREEIRTYYRDEFPQYIESLPRYITPAGPKEWAIAFRDAYPVTGDNRPDKPFIRRSTRHGTSSNPSDPPSDCVFETWDDVLSFIQSPADADPLQQTDSGDRLADPATVDRQRPVAEAVYFGVDTWTLGWPVVVDIDADDVAEYQAWHKLKENGRDVDFGPGESAVEEAGYSDQPPEGKDYRFEDIDQAIQFAFDIERYFQEKLNAAHTLVLYSGQGAHVYLLDNDIDHRYDESARQVIVDMLRGTQQIPIDPVVTPDRRRVMRLPYSLHAGVSRIVTPIDSPDFDPRTGAVPESIDLDPVGQRSSQPHSQQ